MKSIGDGRIIRLWMDKWVFDDSTRRPFNKETQINLNQRVMDLINEVGSWSLERLKELFFEEDVRKIMLFPPNRAMKDEWIWAYSKEGKYSVKSGSIFMSQPVCVVDSVPPEI